MLGMAKSARKIKPHLEKNAVDAWFFSVIVPVQLACLL
jgi:hypothetical protein